MVVTKDIDKVIKLRLRPSPAGPIVALGGIAGLGNRESVQNQQEKANLPSCEP